MRAKGRGDGSARPAGGAVRLASIPLVGGSLPHARLREADDVVQEAWLRMTQAKKPTIDACVTAYLWTLGANRSASSITVYRTVLA